MYSYVVHSTLHFKNTVTLKRCLIVNLRNVCSKKRPTSLSPVFSLGAGTYRVCWGPIDQYLPRLNPFTNTTPLPQPCNEEKKDRQFCCFESLFICEIFQFFWLIAITLYFHGAWHYSTYPSNRYTDTDSWPHSFCLSCTLRICKYFSLVCIPKL